VALRVGELLDESLVVDQSTGLKDEAAKYRITQSGETWDLSKIDFEKLKEEFKCTPHKNIEIADLRSFIQKKLEQMMKENGSRADFATLRPEPIPISSTRPCAAPAVRSRNGIKFFWRIVNSITCGRIRRL